MAPSVEACARCAVANASMTYTSPSAASLRPLLVVLLFALVEAHVLAQDAFAGLYADAVQIVLLKPDRDAEQFLKAFGHRSQRSFFGINAFFGAPKVRKHDDAGAFIQRELQGRNSRPDALVAGDFPFLDRDIEVFTKDNGLPLQIKVGHETYVHCSPPKK